MDTAPIWHFRQSRLISRCRKGILSSHDVSAFAREKDRSMATESGSPRQERWTLAVRRSFGIPDLASSEDARKTLVNALEDALRNNGWVTATHAVADPMADALLAFGAASDFDDELLGAEPPTEAAHRLVAKGLMVVDPEHLAYDVRGEYPPEVVAVAELALVRVMQCIREQPN
jgi:hypothetical protein